MKYFLLIAIRLYWLIVPPGRRRRCLFKESCSRHVYRLTKAEGILAGLGALRIRYRQCRPGDRIVFVENGMMYLQHANGDRAPLEDLSEQVMELGISRIAEMKKTGVPNTC